MTFRRFYSTKYIAGFSISALLAFDGIQNDFVFTKATKRFIRSLSIALLISKDYYFVLKKENEENFMELLKDCHQKSANRILKTCLINGGLYIKIGQGVAVINHILPDEYTKTLSKLEDECLPCNKRDVQKVFLNDFGKLPEEIYDDFDYKPIAAASLAQVFKAKLRDNGNEVAIKVQYNDLEKRFPSDLSTILFLENMVELFFKNYNLGWTLEYVKDNLEQELDFVHEGKNAEKCSKDLKQFKFIHVPEIYWSYTTKRVLTMEWIDGVKITDLEKLKLSNIDLCDLDVKLFKAFSEQIFNSGFVHADPHPGNILVRKMKSGETELILLDHGLYEFMPENVRLPLCKFWEAAVLKDEQEMENSALKLKIDNYKNLAEVLFQAPYETNSKFRIKSKLSDDDINYMQEMAKDHFDKVIITLKQMPANMLLVIRNLNTIRAIGRKHGDPVDRPKLMARYAQKCLYKNQNSFFGFLKWLRRRIIFEYCLIKKGISISIISLYINVLHKLGRSPADSRTIFSIREKYENNT